MGDAGELENLVRQETLCICAGTNDLHLDIVLVHGILHQEMLVC